MNLKRLVCYCHVCEGYAQPHSFWLSDQKQLVITAICVNCEEKTNCIFALPDLFNNCPIPDLPQGLPTIECDDSVPKPFVLTADDKKFMQALKIRFTSP